MLKILASLQHDGKDVIMEFPIANDLAAAQYQVTIKHFRKIDGVFAVPSGARLKSVEIRLIQAGGVKATRSVIL